MTKAFRIITALLLSLLMLTAAAPVSFALDDNEISDWAKEEVEKAKDFGLIPDELLCDYRKGITREEFAVVMVRLFNKGDPHFPATDFEEPKDIAEIKNAEYTDAVRTALKYKLMTLDENGNFNPGKVMTRDEGARCLASLFFVCRRHGFKVGESGMLLKYRVEDYHECARGGAWEVLYFIRVLKGVSEKRLAPQSIFTREQCFVSALRFKRVIDGENYGDG